MSAVHPSSHMDLALANGGYAWWYLDAVSDDGLSALTAIVFAGSVFSPWYFRARHSGNPPAPLQHAAINLSVRTPQGHLWVMNERALPAHSRSRDQYELGGGTRLRWQHGELCLDLDEVTRPFFQRMAPRVRGRLRLRPLVRHDAIATLDTAGRHRWCAVAPHARIEVELDEPRLRLHGHAYHDSNWGDEGLEQAFRGWHWSRAPVRDGTLVVYDTTSCDGQERRLARLFGRDGSTTAVDGLQAAALRPTGWRLARATRSDDGAASVVQTLEDTPFYARSLVQARWRGETAVAVHESLDLQRFSAPWVRFLLPWRSRRQRPQLETATPIALPEVS
jgi:carotenoid 1,2-hydratase